MINNNKLEVVFCGGRSLGLQILRWLLEREDISLVGVCPIPKDVDPDFYDQITQLATNCGCFIGELDEIFDHTIDIGISVNYNRIIGPDYLKKCKKGFYNVHHSYNLRLKGRNITTHAILNSLYENIHYHGTTLHQMSEELDAGAIVSSTSFSIEEDDTAYSLFLKADNAAFSQFVEWFPRIAHETVFPYSPPKEGIHIYKNADIPDRCIDLEKMSKEYIDVLVRAFDFPGKEPAFFLKNNKRIHLVKKPRDEFLKTIELCGLEFYSDAE